MYMYNMYMAHGTMYFQDVLLYRVLTPKTNTITPTPFSSKGSQHFFVLAFIFLVQMLHIFNNRWIIQCNTETGPDFSFSI